MKTRREYRRVTFGRRLDVKRLQAALSRTMRSAAKDPAPEAAPGRLESVLIEPKETTVYLSGNRPGLDAVAKAVKGTFADVRISKASLADARRVPKAARRKS